MKGKTFNKRKDYLDDIAYENKGKPREDDEVKLGLNVKSLKSLPKSTYSVLSDPYTASLPGSEPYNIYNVFNRCVGGSYSGDRTIDGGNTQQYPNSLKSKFLYCPDFMRMKIDLNYRYRPMKYTSSPTATVTSSYVGKQIIEQCRQSIAEATSVLQGTTFTQMAIYDIAVETDLPCGGAQITEGRDTDNNLIYIYENLNDVIYLTTTFYQIYLQENINFITLFNSFRLKQGTMIRSSWNRETPELNGLFSLFNKKSWLGLIDATILGIPGEYVDTDWAKQVAMITAMPSRRSNSMIDPVLEVQATHNHPSKFKLYARVKTETGTSYVKFFDLQTDLVGNIPNDGVKDIFTIFEELSVIFSAEDTMKWARNSDGNSETQTSRYNRAKYRVDVVNACMTKFKIKMNDIREVLDVLTRTTLNTWVKGFRPSIIKDTDAALFDNQLLNDIFKTALSGANVVKYDDATKRFRTYSLWNLYKGIAEYDAYVGGCFLTFSAKTVQLSEDSDYVKEYIPLMFYVDAVDPILPSSTPIAKMVDRLGNEYNIASSDVTIATDDVLSRLAPLASQNGLQIKVPHITNAEIIEGDDYETSARKAHIVRVLTQIFGLCKLTAQSKTSLDPDILAIYEVEIQDITNDVVAYARATNVFKGTYDTTRDMIGFSTFGAKGQVKLD